MRGEELDALSRELEVTAHLAGLAPDSHETGGKNRRAPILKENIYLKAILVKCARAAAHAKGAFFSAKFNQLCRRGVDYRKALVAIARKLIVVIHRILSGKAPFHGLGAAYFETKPRHHYPQPTAEVHTNFLGSLKLSKYINSVI